MYYFITCVLLLVVDNHMHLIGQARPRIADVNCSRLHFDPGDRVLVRTTHRLEKESERKLRRSIQKWAGCEVEVLIYIKVEKNNAIRR